MKKSIIITTFCAALAYVVLTSSSSGLSTDNTGAQGTTGCSCHSPSANSLINVTIELDSAGSPVTHYVGGGSYTIKLSGTNNTSFSLPYFGFQLTTVKAAGAGTGTAVYTGTLASSGLPTGCKNTTVGTLHLVEHNTPNVATTGTGATGTTYVRSIAWTAPATGTGSVSLYGVINAVNHNGSSSGDYWNAATAVTISEFVPLGAITGDSTVCAGSTFTLSDATTGGTYTSSNTTVATVGGTSGIVMGLVGGTATITYTVGTQTAVRGITVNTVPATPSPISGSATVCAGATITLSEATPGGTWSAVNSRAMISSGVVMGVSGGIDTIKYTVSNTCGSSAASYVVTVNTPILAGTITGTPSLCVGSVATFNDTVAGGVWSSSDTAVAKVFPGGIVVGTGTGTVILTYSISGLCGLSSAYSAPLSVSTPPNPGSIAGPYSVCLGGTATLTDSITGGVWSATNTHISITPGGIVTGNSVGEDTLMYTVTAGCGPATAYFWMGVDTTPHAGPIVGSSTLCVGATVTITDSIYSGYFGSGVSVAFSDSNLSFNHSVGHDSAAVTGLVAGVDTMTLIVTDACGTINVQKVFTINPAPNAGTISGLSTVCLGGVATLSDSVSGGVWSSSDTFTTVSGPGVINGHRLGSDTIRYSVTNSCGTASASFPVTVSSTVVAGTISGATSLCGGTSASFAATVSGGVWSSSNSHALVGTGGVVTAVSAGTDTVNYTVTETCGSATASLPITINATPSPITGSATLCSLTAGTYTDSLTGGTWSVSDTSIATITGTGVATPHVAGTASFIISYTTTSGCIATTPVEAINIIHPSSVTGIDSVCAGSTITLSDSVAGGIWTTTNSHASISGIGIITGISAGTDTVSYAITNACGVGKSHFVVRVTGGSASAGVISGGTAVCPGDTLHFSETVSGGNWSVSNGNATVTTGGVVTGVTGGVDTVRYSIVNSCGTTTATKVITTHPAPYAGSITGPQTVCSGATSTLVDSISGGTWFSIGGHVSTSTVGILTGTSMGTSTVGYAVANSCGTDTAVFTVYTDTLPTLSPIIGTTSLCIGASVTITDSVTGGGSMIGVAVTPTVSNGHMTLDTLAGMHAGLGTGVSAGLDTVMLTAVNVCGSATTTKVFTVNPAPVAGTISGTDSVCAGAMVAWSTTVSGGTWTATNSDALPMAGNITGVAAGVDTVIYTVSNLCGSAIAKKAITVLPLPAACILPGADSLCPGATTTVNPCSVGGTWSVHNGHASIAGGVVTAITGGIDTVVYTVTNSCGVDSARTTVTVRGLAHAGPITSHDSICVSDTVMVADSVAGGTFRLSNSLAALIGAKMFGVAQGKDTLYYTLTGICNSDTVQQTITINPQPVAGSITGDNMLCVGTTVTLYDGGASGTGTWSCTNGHATITSLGVVTGVSGGTDTVKYSVTNVCATRVASYVITSNGIPNPGTISGPAVVCIGASATLVDTVSGGIWSVRTSKATIHPGGVLTGVAVGIDTAVYTVASFAGCLDSVLFGFTVSTAPATPTVSGVPYVCIGGHDTLYGTPAGGIWAATNGDVNVSGGVLTGIAAGKDTVSYNLVTACGTLTAAAVINVFTPIECDSVLSVNTVLGEMETITCYPNPNNGHFAVALPSSCCGSIIVTDVYGNNIWTGTASGKTAEVDLGRPTAGTYFIAVRNGMHTYRGKIIVY